MDRVGTFASAIGLSLVLAGCASGAASPTPAPANLESPATETPAAQPPLEPSATAGPGYQDDYGYGTGGESTATAAPTTAAQATIDAGPTSLGTVVVDAAGFTLYFLASDSPTQSTCNGGCASNWPPVLASGPAVAGAGLDPTLIGTFDRGGGAMQVTYAGHPLYHFTGDHAPGDVAGQGRNGVWFVLAPDGTIIR